MKILMLAPAHASLARGNLVTVERWRRGLQARGHDVEVSGPAAADGLCERFDLVHAHHAVHCGPAALACQACGKPVVVSLGGTDLNGGPEGLPDPRAREVFEKVDRIVGPVDADGVRLRAAIPAAAPFRRVRRGVELGAAAPAPANARIVGYLAGGLREVKGQLDALRWSQDLRARGLDLELRLAGPVIDEDYAREFREAIAAQPEDLDLGELSPADSAIELAGADFLLNASHHEGASNAILEALAIGRPVAARHAPGNREMLASAPREAALLFEGRDAVNELERWLRELKAGNREEIAKACRRFVAKHHDAATELDELEAVYRELVEAPDQ